MMIRYKVTLTREEHEQLEAALSRGKHSSQKYKNTCILISTDEGPHGYKLSNEQIAQVLKINPKTVERVKQRFIEELLTHAWTVGHIRKKGRLRLMVFLKPNWLH